MHIYSEGERSPTVLYTASSGTFSAVLDFSYIQRELPSTTRPLYVKDQDMAGAKKQEIRNNRADSSGFAYASAKRTVEVGTLGDIPSKKEYLNGKTIKSSVEMVNRQQMGQP